MAVMNLNLLSVMLKHTIDCTIVLPDHLPQEQLKCIWLYHGGSGDHKAWLYHTSLVDKSESRKCAFVLPDVDESCFVNMKYGDKYSSYVGNELPKTIWNLFACISSDRLDNYIAGFSNGGYGCLHTALRYPQLYAKVGAFSAGDKADSDFCNDGSEKSKARIALFGDGDLHETEYGLTHLANKLLTKNVDKPEIYHACGGKDPWLDKNLMLRRYFESHPEFTYTYDQVNELGQEWKFWNMELDKFLDYCGLAADLNATDSNTFCLTTN